MSVEKLIVDHMETWTSALQTRSTAGRGSSGKIDLYGIKKLRELILELAVRGKLVQMCIRDSIRAIHLNRFHQNAACNMTNAVNQAIHWRDQRGFNKMCIRDSDSSAHPRKGRQQHMTRFISSKQHRMFAGSFTAIQTHQPKPAQAHNH